MSLRRYIGAFEIVAVGWTALLATAVAERPTYVLAVVVSSLAAVVCMRRLVVFSRTCTPAPAGTRLLVSTNGTHWGLWTMVAWNAAAVSIFYGEASTVLVMLVGGILG